MRTYTAVCERVGTWWEITVPELKYGQVTQAKSLDDVQPVVRDLVALLTGTPREDIAVEVRVKEHSQRRWRLFRRPAP